MMTQFILYILLGFLLAWLIWFGVRALLSKTGWYLGRGPCLQVYVPSKDLLPLLTRSKISGDK